MLIRCLPARIIGFTAKTTFAFLEAKRKRRRCRVACKRFGLGILDWVVVRQRKSLKAYLRKRLRWHTHAGPRWRSVSQAKCLSGHMQLQPARSRLAYLG